LPVRGRAVITAASRFMHGAPHLIIFVHGASSNLSLHTGARAEKRGTLKNSGAAFLPFHGGRRRISITLRLRSTRTTAPPRRT